MHKRGTAKRCHAVVADADDIVGHARHIGPAGGGRAVQHDHRRNARGAQPSEIAEQHAAIGPELDLIFHQVGASAFDQMDEWQLEILRDFLRALARIPATGSCCTGADTTVIDPDHAAYALDKADTEDHAATGDAGVGIAVLDQIIGHIVELKPRHAGIEQALEPLVRGQLAAFFKGRPPFFRCHDGTVLEPSQMIDQGEHALSILRKTVGTGDDLRFELGHMLSFSAFSCPPLYNEP